MGAVMPTRTMGFPSLVVDKQLLDTLCVFEIHTIYSADDKRAVIGWAIDEGDWAEVERLLYRMYRTGKVLAKPYRPQKPVVVYDSRLKGYAPEGWVIK